MFRHNIILICLSIKNVYILMAFYFSSDRTSVCERWCRRNVRVLGRFPPYRHITNGKPARLFVGGVVLLLAASPIVNRSPSLILSIVIAIVSHTNIDSCCWVSALGYRDPFRRYVKRYLFFFHAINIVHVGLKVYSRWSQKAMSNMFGLK